MQAYKANKYSREHSRFNGQLLFDPDLEEISVTKAAKMLGIDPMHVYYMIRRGKLPCKKKGCTIVLSFEEVKKLRLEDPRQVSFL